MLKAAAFPGLHRLGFRFQDCKNIDTTDSSCVPDTWNARGLGRWVVSKDS